VETRIARVSIAWGKSDSAIRKYNTTYSFGREKPSRPFFPVSETLELADSRKEHDAPPCTKRQKATAQSVETNNNNTKANGGVIYRPEALSFTSNFPIGHVLYIHTHSAYERPHHSKGGKGPSLRLLFNFRFR
jgi:hypothetical protein